MTCEPPIRSTVILDLMTMRELIVSRKPIPEIEVLWGLWLSDAMTSKRLRNRSGGGVEILPFNQVLTTLIVILSDASVAMTTMPVYLILHSIIDRQAKIKIQGFKTSGALLCCMGSLYKR